MSTLLAVPPAAALPPADVTRTFGCEANREPGPFAGNPPDSASEGPVSDDSPATRGGARASVLAACLRRLSGSHLSLVITAPLDTDSFWRGIGRFPERWIEPSLHARWDRAYRGFCGGGEQPHEPGSWRLLAFDAEARILGAVTARFFCGAVVREYVHAFSLLKGAAPALRAPCEQSVFETFAQASRHDRTPAEVSHWTSGKGRHARLVGATLQRALVALAAAFDLPVAIAAATHGSSEFSRLTRLSRLSLWRNDRHGLPPFVHQPTGARIRLVVLDTAELGSRLRAAAADLAVLRERCPILSLR
jgi:hypothetical protein